VKNRRNYSPTHAITRKKKHKKKLFYFSSYNNFAAYIYYNLLLIFLVPRTKQAPQTPREARFTVNNFTLKFLFILQLIYLLQLSINSTRYTARRTEKRSRRSSNNDSASPAQGCPNLDTEAQSGGPITRALARASAALPLAATPAAIAATAAAERPGASSSSSRLGSARYH